jgi:hypothetical protein
LTLRNAKEVLGYYPGIPCATPNFSNLQSHAASWTRSGVADT